MKNTRSMCDIHKLKTIQLICTILWTCQNPWRTTRRNFHILVICCRKLCEISHQTSVLDLVRSSIKFSCHTSRPCRKSELNRKQFATVFLFLTISSSAVDKSDDIEIKSWFIRANLNFLLPKSNSQIAKSLWPMRVAIWLQKPHESRYRHKTVRCKFKSFGFEKSLSELFRLSEKKVILNVEC